MIGAHGRTRTCTSLVRTQALCPLSYVCAVCCCRDGTQTPVCRLRADVSMPRDERRKIGSPTRIRTWIDQLTTGRPTVGRSGNGGAPRTRTELNLLAREIRGPCACPEWLCLGGQTLAPRARSDGERSDPHGLVVPGAGFEPTSPRLQRGAFTRLASQAELNVVRPTGIEPVSARWHRAALPLSYGRPSFQEWCTEQDSNLRSPKAPDLQSGLVAA